jgi:hypothetical protein
MTTNEPTEHGDVAMLRALFRVSDTSQNVTINGNTAGLITSLVGVFAICFALCAVVVVAVMHSNAVDDMAAIRSRISTLEQYREQHARRIEAMEPQTKAETKP